MDALVLVVVLAAVAGAFLFWWFSRDMGVEPDLRDYFAGQALPAMIGKLGPAEGLMSAIEGAYIVADAMLIERAK